MAAEITNCERCHKAPATTHQEYRHEGDHPSWADTKTDRCGGCAEALRNYAALPSISLAITVDRSL